MCDFVRFLRECSGLFLSLNLASASMPCSNREILIPAIPAPLGFRDARRTSRPALACAPNFGPLTGHRTAIQKPIRNQSSSSNATMRRPSASRILNVRQAAPVSIVSRPTPRRASAYRNSVGGRHDLPRHDGRVLPRLRLATPTSGCVNQSLKQSQAVGVNASVKERYSGI